MFGMGRKTNRRRVESKLSTWRLPRIGLPWRSRLKTALAVALLGGALFGLFRGAKFVLDQPARNLVVEGTFQRVTPLQIEAAVMNGHDGGFVSTDLGELRRRVKAIDWVDRVNVGRSWPDTLIVRVTEHQAAARWGENGLLNVRGELFTEQAQHELSRAAATRGAAAAANGRSRGVISPCAASWPKPI